MKGWRSLNELSRVYKRHLNTLISRFGFLISDFAISIYQSQNSCHINWYISEASSLKRYSSSALFVLSVAVASLLSIQLLERFKASTLLSAISFWFLLVSIFIIMNRAAFQSLFTKCLYPSTLSSENLTSLPCAANAARANLKASVPYLSISGSGSTTFR